MKRSIRWTAISLLSMYAALSLLATTAIAAGVPPAPNVPVHFTHESYQAFQRQLSGGQIHAVTFNKKAHTVHVTLNNGRLVLASYPSHNEPQLAAQLEAKGVSVTVERHKSKAKPVHHKLRYIAGAILVIVILVILAVLLVGRRRSLAQAGGGGLARAGGSNAHAGGEHAGGEHAGGEHASGEGSAEGAGASAAPGPAGGAPGSG